MPARIPASAALIAVCCLALSAPLAQAADARGKMVTASYLVADLVIPVENFGTPQTAQLPPNGAGNIAWNVQPTPLEYFTGGSQLAQPCPTLNQCGGSMNMASGNGQAVRQAVKNTQERMLIDLITKTIAPRSWSDSGGPGSIDYHPLTMALVINQTPDVQEQVADLLAALRRMQDVQVALDVRVLTISDDMSDYLMAPNARISSTKKGSYQLELLPSPPGSMSFLSQKQVALLLEMVRSDRRTNIMQAPKITLLNGQTGTMCIGDTQNYVTGLDVTSSGGQVTVHPKNETVSTGFRMRAQPVVSADRRFVQVSLNLKQTDLASAPVPVVPVTVNVKGAEGKDVLFTQYLQQAKHNTFNMEKTVAIPDGGTVLIGGLKKVIETREEYGPAVLSKIPYLNRLFTNVSYGQEPQMVLVLVTPRVIVNAEEEPKAVPAPAQCATAPDACCDAEEQETPAKPEKLGRQEKMVSDLLKAYDEACAEGRKAEAKKLARAALTIDPTCFRDRR